MQPARLAGGEQKCCLPQSSALEAQGKVQRLTKGGSRRAYYRYKAASECTDHLHLSCEKCGKTYHMPLGATNRLIDNVKQNSVLR